MNRIKDFIYDKNDLLVALIIVTLAALVIIVRVDTIMAYPSSSNVATNPPITDDKPPVSDETSMGGSIIDDEDEDGTDGHENFPDDEKSEEDEGNQEQNQPTGNESLPNNKIEGEGLVSIYIEYGATGSDIARLLINAGLVETREDFYDAVRETGADTKLKAGNFKIPANATPLEIVKIITN